MLNISTQYNSLYRLPDRLFCLCITLFLITSPFSPSIASAASEQELSNLEESIAGDQDPYSNRLLLAIYHMGLNKNLPEALRILDEILKEDPENQKALFLKKHVEQLQSREAAGSDPGEDNYQKYSDLTAEETITEPQAIVDPVPEDETEPATGEEKGADVFKKYGLAGQPDSKTGEAALLDLFKSMKFSEFKELRAALREAGVSLGSTVELLSSQLDTIENKKALADVEIPFVGNISDVKHLETIAATLDSMEEFFQARQIYNHLFQLEPKKEYALKLVDINLQLGELEKAEVALYSLKRLDVGEAELADAEYQIQRFKSEALEEVKQNYEESPDFETFKRYLTLLFDFQHLEEVENLIKGYLVLNVQNKEEKLKLAGFLAGIGKFKESIAVLYSMESLNDPEVKLMLGKTLYWDNQPDKALNYLVEVIGQEPGGKVSTEAKKALGFIHLWQNDVDRARKIFLEVLAENPDDEEVSEELLLMDRNVVKLISRYERLHQEDKKKDLYMYKLARLYSAAGDLDKAIHYYELYLENHPEDLNIYQALSGLYLRKKDYAKGFGLLEYYTKKKESAETLLVLAKAYLLVGYEQKSIDVLDELLEKYEGYTKAVELKSQIEIKGEVAKAKARIIQESFQPPDMSRQRLKGKYAKQLQQAEKLFRDGFFKASLPYFQVYVVNETEDHEMRYRYALALEMSERYDEAAGELYLLTEVMKDADVLYHYGFNLELSGRWEEARKVYHLVMGEQPKTLPDYLDNFLKIWAGVLERKDFELFSSLYSREIRENEQWREGRQAGFKSRTPMVVSVSDGSVMFERDSKKLIKFYLERESGGNREKGYTIFELKCDEDEECLILNEKFIQGEKKSLDDAVFQLAREREQELEEAREQKLAEEVNESLARPPMLEPGPISDTRGELELFSQLDEECRTGQDCSKPEQITSTSRVETIETGESAGGLSLFSAADQRLSKLSGSPPKDSPFTSFSEKKKELGGLASILSQAAPPYGFENYFYPELLSASSVNIGPLKLMFSTEYFVGDGMIISELVADPVELMVFTSLAGLKWYWYQNASDTEFVNVAAYYEDSYDVVGIDFKSEAGWFEIDDEEGREPGTYLHASAAKYNLELGAQFYMFDEFSQVNPFIKYRQSLGGHALEYIFYRRNAGLIAKYSTCPVRQNIDGWNLQINDYLELPDGNHFWGAVDFTSFTDSNFAVTPQFNFYFHSGAVGLLEYKYLLFGWYNFNTQTTECYYSPTSYDSTWFGIELDYPVSHNFSLLGKAGIGYSLSDNTSLYQIGGWLEYELANGFYAKAGCSKHNSQQNTALSTVFDYEECEARIEYRW